MFWFALALLRLNDFQIKKFNCHKSSTSRMRPKADDNYDKEQILSKDGGTLRNLEKSWEIL